MKGVIFNILEEFVIENWGVETYERILAACPVHMHDGHVAPGTYADADLLAIVDQTCRTLRVEPDDALRGFGRFAFARLASRYPTAVEGVDGPYEFMRRIDDTIHVEVRKLMPQASTPRITCHDDDDAAGIRVSYQSKRRLCPLFTGLVEGVGDRYRRRARYQHLACTRDGADRCEFRLVFERLDGGIA